MNEAKPPLFVVDASVAAKWYLRDEEWLDQADALLEDYGSNRVTLGGPDNLSYEVLGLIDRASRRKRIDRSVALVATDGFLRLGIPTVPTRHSLREVVAMGHRQDCSFYDALYLWVADLLGAPLITADDRLYNVVRAPRPQIMLLRDHSVASPPQS